MDTEHFDVVVLGAGISGIGAAYHLQDQRPGTTFVVLEAHPTFGGTWWTNRYPGVRSDSEPASPSATGSRRGAGDPIADRPADPHPDLGEVIEENATSRRPLPLLPRLVQLDPGGSSGNRRREVEFSSITSPRSVRLVSDRVPAPRLEPVAEGEQVAVGAHPGVAVGPPGPAEGVLGLDTVKVVPGRWSCRW